MSPSEKFEEINKIKPSEFGSREKFMRKNKPLYLNLRDFKAIIRLFELIEDDGHELYQDELELRAKVQTIISYIERARLREGGQS